jgi:hypothetical protein
MTGGITPSTSAKLKIIGLFIGVWILFSVVSYFLVVVPGQQRFDLYARWVGSRAMLKGESPYSESVTLNIQQGMFGRHLESHEDQNRFAYTPLVTWLLLPFWLIPFPMAISLWCGLQFILLFITPLFVIASLQWRINFTSLIIILLFSTVLYRHPINAYLIGQFIPFVVCCIAIALWGIVQGYETLTGIALLWAMVRPEVTIILVLTLLFIAYQKGQTKVIVVWLMGIFILWLITHLFIGTWEFEFVEGIIAYSGYALLVWPPSLIGNWLSQLVFVIVILGWVIWILWELRQLHHVSRSVWRLSVAVIASLLLIPQTGYYNLMLGLLPSWLLFWVMSDRILGWIPVFVVLFSPWIFHEVLKKPSLGFLAIPVMLLLIQSMYWLLWKKRNPLKQVVV